MDRFKNHHHVEQFAKRLGYQLLEKGMTQVELGRKIGISKQTVSKYLKGDVLPSVDTLITIAKELDCSLDYLFDIEEKSII